MTIAVTLEQYLGRNGIAYDVLPHALITSSLRTVEASHVPADALAKTRAAESGGQAFVEF